MRLEQLAASAFTGKEIDVHRVTAPNGSAKTQFRGIINYANGSGVVHQGVLDLLVKDAEADISFDTIYVRTISISDMLGTNDSIQIKYVSNYETEGESAMPIRIISIGSIIIEKETKARSQRVSPKAGEEVNTPIQYILEERGLVTVVKDVTELDSKQLWVRTGLTKVYVSTILRRGIERDGFAEYMTPTKKGSLKRVLLVPRGTEERIYKGLTLDTFTDLKLIAKENVEAYTREKGQSEIDLRKAAKVKMQGKKYYLASQIEEIMKRVEEQGHEEAGIEISKGTIFEKKKKERTGSIDSIVDVHQYKPLGTVSNGIYSYEGRNAPLFDETKAYVRYGDVFSHFTPWHIKSGARSPYQTPMRRIIIKTTAAKDRRDAEGNPVSETELGRGKKHYLETRVANQCIRYLVDQGYSKIH